MARTSLHRRRIAGFVVGHRHLLLSFAAGLALLVLLPQGRTLAARFTLAWDLTVLLYVGSTLLMIFRLTVTTCHDRAALHDEGDWLILVLVVASASASFVAVYAELASLTSADGALAPGLVITAATVALSWAITHIVFTLHYANVYYKPDMDDFLYDARVIGSATQTADVATVSLAMRRLTLAHCVVAFIFNTVILALTINVGASLLH